MFFQMLFQNRTLFFMVLLIVIFSVCLHEFFHAWVGVREGDEDLREHLTLNPLKQMGFMSILMLAFFGIAWGNIPLNRENLRSRWSELKVALAGPCANLLLFLISLISFAALCAGLRPENLHYGQMQTLLQFVLTAGIYNFVLLVFNLMPVPGFDGWTILTSFFPKLPGTRSEFFKGAMVFAIFFVFFIIPYLFRAGQFIMIRTAVRFLE